MPAKLALQFRSAGRAAAKRLAFVSKREITPVRLPRKDSFIHSSIKSFAKQSFVPDPVLDNDVKDEGRLLLSPSPAERITFQCASEIINK